MHTKFLQVNCCQDACDSAAATILNYQVFCLNHFLLRCYERLEAIDSRVRDFREGPVDLAAFRAFIDECSGKALDVSLRYHQDLDNLQRGRLLDILLWAGELYLLLHAPRTCAPTRFIGRRELPNFGPFKSIWALSDSA